MKISLLVTMAILLAAASAQGQYASQAARARATIQGSVTQVSSGRAPGARGVTGQAGLSGLTSGIHAFYTDVGRLPNTTEGLSILIYRPPGVRNWNGPYVTVPQGKPPFTDPWGNLYRYIDTTLRGGQPTFTIKSNGPDGLPDTADDLSVSG